MVASWPSIRDAFYEVWLLPGLLGRLHAYCGRWDYLKAIAYPEKDIISVGLNSVIWLHEFVENYFRNSIKLTPVLV